MSKKYCEHCRQGTHPKHISGGCLAFITLPVWPVAGAYFGDEGGLVLGCITMVISFILAIFLSIKAFDYNGTTCSVCDTLYSRR